ncbi:hypothetical protein [Hahella ganghwensis]|uniref:hypothetical protein n=1 Tax=Hahella ganghwensis TaxID=286420 RepID=UPI00036902E4|nr:hypothetical protein [Hahella ganghwensis]
MSAQIKVCNWAKGWANNNKTVTWTNHEPASTLCQWYRANVTSNDPPMPASPGSTTMMVCFELPLYAAVCSGAITPAKLKELYHRHWNGNESWDSIYKNDWVWKTHKVGTPGAMSAGDIVFFNRMAHVAMATGNGDEVVSVWGMDISGIAANTPIELTTISALYASVRQQTARVRSTEGIGVGAPGGNQVQEVKVEYTGAPW